MTWDWLMLLGLAAIVFVQSLLTWTIRADAFADKVDLSQLHAWLIYLWPPGVSQTSHTDSSVSNPLINVIRLIQWFFQASHRLDRMNYTATTGFEIQDKQM